jgi:hypothetical protein
MQDLVTAVGTGQANASADAALVQAMLVLIRRPASGTTPAGPYLANYDGDWGRLSNAALRAFQTDHVFVAANGTPLANVTNATAGVVNPGDVTWQRLVANVPDGFENLRALAGSTTVYVAAVETDLTAKLQTAQVATFTETFRTKVIACINRMYELHRIAVGVCPQGDRRTFQQQYALFTNGRNVTNAGPGESNHNFGMAVDMGFQGLRWLRADGTVVDDENWWLYRLDPRQIVNAQSLIFWNALREVGISASVGMFRGPLRDRPHLQNWDDAGVNMRLRLADLLTRSSDNGMQWGFADGNYRSDFGLGGQHYAVGTAANIWNNNATLTTRTLTEARAAAAAALQAQRQPPRPGLGPATADDVTAMKAELRRQFELADANWQAWTPN